MLEHEPRIFEEHDCCHGNELHQLKHNNKILFHDLLPQLIRGKTWIALNFNWPSPNLVKNIPQDQDTYIFSWHLENIDFDFLDRFCLEHPNQQVIVLSENTDNNRHPNLKMLQYHCWHHVIPTMLIVHGYNTKFINIRNKRLSSLASKPSLSKALITAYLHCKYKDRTDVIMSWQLLRSAKCHSMNFIDDLKTTDQLAHLVDHYNRYLKDECIKLPNDITPGSIPWNNWHFPSFVYDVWVNLTNETFCRDDGIFPGPYLSEKTWKALIAGTALLPVGMSGTYQRLEKFGFQFEYGWDLEFDIIRPDMDRMIKLFDLVDLIIKEPIDDLAAQVRDSCKYNHKYIRSDEFVKRIKDLNQQNLKEFLSTY